MINIDDLIGVRYVRNGRSPKGGFDCLGFTIEIEKRFGHNLPDIKEAMLKDYDFTKCKEIELQQVEGLIPSDKPDKEGDIILFEDSNGIMFHIGVYLGDNKYIHCNRYGVHINKVNQGYKIGAVYTWQ